MNHDFPQLDWDPTVQDDCRQLVRLAVREDLGRSYDLTTLAMVEPRAEGRAEVVSRAAGVAAGLQVGPLLFDEMNAPLDWLLLQADGTTIGPGTPLARVEGPTRHLLTAERILLNFMSRLCGVASLTARYVEAVAGTPARIYDTRKTTPGWRRLEKYAVRCGGGHNHRTGLFDAVLIKDNHLAQAGLSDRPAEAVRRARQFLVEAAVASPVLLEVEVDSLSQFDDVLAAGPDLVLLDNMSLDDLRTAVQRRDAAGARIELEASGGIELETVTAIAETGVDRISVGALTHSATGLDLGLDWRSEAGGRG